jgi:hypothetical protein
VLHNIFKCFIFITVEVMEIKPQVGRPSKEDKKIREAIYFEPDLLDWLKEKSDEEERTVSSIVNRIVRDKKENG